jgi:hypothetical protein
MAAGEEMGAGMAGEGAAERTSVGWLFSGSAGDLEASEARALVPLYLGLVRALETPKGSETRETI